MRDEACQSASSLRRSRLTQASMLLRWSELLMPRSRSISACRDSTLPASLASAQST